MSRMLVVDNATGTIDRVITGNPAVFANQAGAGKVALALTVDSGEWIDDANLIVNMAGEIEPHPSAPPGYVAPTVQLELIP